MDRKREQHTLDLFTRPGHGHNDEGERRRVAAEVNVAAHPGSVAMARTVVREAATAAGLDEDRIDDVLVCISEAVTNAIEAQGDGSIGIRCLVSDTTFTVEVRDSAGGGFDPAQLAPRPPLTDPGHLDVERGWGIHLMRELLDRVEFEAIEDGTIARLVVDR